MFVLFVENRRKKEEKVIQRRICDELETAIPSHDQVAERKLLQREDVGVDCQSGVEMCEHDVHHGERRRFGHLLQIVGRDGDMQLANTVDHRREGKCKQHGTIRVGRNALRHLIGSVAQIGQLERRKALGGRINKHVIHLPKPL